MNGFATSRTMGKGALRPGRRSSAGITLIELMIVVVVVSVLAGIALPSYRQYTLRTHRTEAKTALLQLAANQERYYLANRRYGTLVQLGAAGFPTKTEFETYTLAVNSADYTRTYTATATPRVGGGTTGIDMTGDTECAVFVINAERVRSAAPDPRNRCW